MEFTRAQVDEAIDAFLAEHDVKELSEVEYRGARYDADAGDVESPGGERLDAEVVGSRRNLHEQSSRQHDGAAR